MSEVQPVVRCAIYTRKSIEEGLDQAFNALQAQREAAEAYILSQKQKGWHTLAQRYEDGGFSGASLDRPALKQLLASEVVYGFKVPHRLQCALRPAFVHALALLEFPFKAASHVEHESLGL